jgi:hypothetical protein
MAWSLSQHPAVSTYLLWLLHLPPYNLFVHSISTTIISDHR